MKWGKQFVATSTGKAWTFPLDQVGIAAAVTALLPSELQIDAMIVLVNNGKLSVNLSSQPSDTVITAIQGYYDGLTQNAQAIALALPSRKSAADKASFETSVKNFIATLDWSAMTPAERKFAMQGTLSTTEYDSLRTHS